MIILIIGDFHYPDRAKFPKKIFEFLKIKSYDLIFCTGDLTELTIFEELQRLGAPIKIVQGNMDWKFKHPEKYISKIDNLNIGLIHGHQIHPRGDFNKLSIYSRKLDVKILISGHTHSQSITHTNNILLINPGSATGAWSFVADRIPSFIIMKILGNMIHLKSYQLINKNFKIKIKEFNKNKI